MNIAHIETSSSIYGPGERYVIWVQGCSIRCEACWNYEMWSLETKIQKSVEELFKEIEQLKIEIEGITILGGEALDQYEEVFELCKKNFQSGLSVMLYTGYEREEIQSLQKEEILEFVDILIPGRYKKEFRNTNLQWRGSENQEIQFLTKRYSSSIVEEGNYVEINIDEWGSTTILGYPDESFNFF